MLQVPLIDKSFSHSPSGYATDRKSSIGAWKREFNANQEQFVVLTDTTLGQIFNFVDKNIKVYAWILEPEVINPKPYAFIRKHYNLFHKIFTWNKSLLDISDKFQFVPFGTCWINDVDCQLHNKTKNISMMISKKQKTQGHLLRHSIFDRYKDSINVFGRNYNPIENKITALKEYKFHIVVENSKEDNWFTEKIIDCFQTGTILIYWGCTSIDKFFSGAGIIKFNDQTELEKIIPTLDDKLYNKLLPSVQENFLESKKYLVMDDFVFKHIKNDNS